MEGGRLTFSLLCSGPPATARKRQSGGHRRSEREREREEGWHRRRSWDGKIDEGNEKGKEE